jgi:hypothetical protein
MDEQGLIQRDSVYPYDISIGHILDSAAIFEMETWQK